MIKALENKENSNHTISAGLLIVLVTVALAGIVMLGATVTSIAASPMDPTNSTDTNQTDAGQISSKAKHDTAKSSVRNMK